MKSNSGASLYKSLDDVFLEELGIRGVPSVYPQSWLSKQYLGDELHVKISFAYEDIRKIDGFWGEYLEKNHIVAVAHAAQPSKNNQFSSAPSAPILIRGDYYRNMKSADIMFVDILQIGGKPYYVAELKR
ncbi:MAG: hypothetical protein NDI94_02710 [Candidatus Woesearchaeota archaeon]|nr:hypothetical protein [Candidatus Woesearchaeota archaeon]